MTYFLINPNGAHHWYHVVLIVSCFVTCEGVTFQVMEEYSNFSFLIVTLEYSTAMKGNFLWLEVCIVITLLLATLKEYYYY